MLSLLVSALVAAAPSPEARPVVAVMYFDNNTANDKYDVLRKGLADMIITDLVAWDGVVVVERERLESVLGELKLQQSKAVDAQTAAKIGKLLGARYSVVGSMSLDARRNELILDAHLRDVQKGSIVISGRASASPDSLFDLEQKLVDELVRGIDAKLTPNAMARRKARVPNLDAAALYSEALELTDQGKLEEAQAAMRKVVSTAPTFLLARVRQEQLLARFQEYQARKRELVTDTVLELAKRCSEALAKAEGFNTFTQAETEHFLALRTLHGRFIIRSARQFYSSHDGSTRVAKRGQEAQALVAQRAWLANQRKLIDELASANARFPGLQARLTPDEDRLVEASQLGSVQLSDPFLELSAFVLGGHANDGDSVTLLPAVGAVDPAEGAEVLHQLDLRLQLAIAKGKTDPQSINDAFSWATERASAALEEDDVDRAVSTYQRVLDVFPTARQSADFESRIKRLLENGLPDARKARWAQGLKTCTDMDLLVGFSSPAADAWLRHAGLKGLDDALAALEKACPKLGDSTRSILMSHAAQRYAHAEDCVAMRATWRKYLAAHGSVKDLFGWSRQLTWCPLNEVTTGLAYFYGQRNRDWDIELTDHLKSTLKGDVLTVSGEAWIGTPRGRKPYSLSLVATMTGTCTSADYLRYDGTRETGTCTIEFKQLATKPGEFDEGTFSVNIIEDDDGMKQKLEFSDGVFKVRRE